MKCSLITTVVATVVGVAAVTAPASSYAQRVQFKGGNLAPSNTQQHPATGSQGFSSTRNFQSLPKTGISSQNIGKAQVAPRATAPTLKNIPLGLGGNVQNQPNNNVRNPQPNGSIKNFGIGNTVRKPNLNGVIKDLGMGGGVSPKLPVQPIKPHVKIGKIPFPKPGVIAPGIGNGQPPSGGAHPQQHKPHHYKQAWCGSKPKQCWWWFDYCQPLQVCQPKHYSYCNWSVVRCDYVVGGNVVVANASWYLGIHGMILPGQGLGIEKVDAGSPAELAGLQPGMVIVTVNGVDLIDEQALASVMQQSNGVLVMHVLAQQGGNLVAVQVPMRLVTRASY